MIVYLSDNRYRLNSCSRLSACPLAERRFFCYITLNQLLKKTSKIVKKNINEQKILYIGKKSEIKKAMGKSAITELKHHRSIYQHTFTHRRIINPS